MCVRHVLVLLQPPAMGRGVVRGLFVISGCRGAGEWMRWGYGEWWRVKYIFCFVKIFFAAVLGERVWEKKSVG